jgi:hypothetical protein
MNSNPLMQVVLDNLVFFALASDEIIRPDECVRRLEEMATELRKLSSDDKREFLRFVETAAVAEERHGNSRERIEFLRTIGENLGISE